MRIPEKLEDEARRPPGQIITFYSYKGGTGRSMALANVAWILASSGHRVVVIDWDLEAPGLHRYFRPFLADPELSETPGIIDFFVHFTEAARMQARMPTETASSNPPWFFDRADLLRYSVPLNYEFPDGGVLDFVAAGRQGPSYGLRVNSFQWSEFYEKLGGGIFLEAMKAQLREQYEYVLIDSRTGLSDTSGICTVQMPDELVVCFTFNRQSIVGAAAVAASADAQRRLSTGENGLRIWPVPTRVEQHEKERLEAAQLMARKKFAPFLWHVPPARRVEYWGSVEMPYFPYYAYEEVLATIADLPKKTSSLLASMERLTARLTLNKVTAMPPFDRGVREQLLARYQPVERASTTVQAQPQRFYISYAKADESTPVVRMLGAALDRQFGPNAAFWDELVPFGVDWQQALNIELRKASILIVVVGPNWRDSTGSRHETEVALSEQKLIIPLGLQNTLWERLPPELRSRRGAQLFGIGTLDEEIYQFVQQLAASLPRVSLVTSVDIDDPHKGQFGGERERAGRRLTARVTQGKRNLLSRLEWFHVRLEVAAIDDRPLEGDVEFNLHPSFRPAMVRVPVHDGRAVLEHHAWGAFTVGAAADGGRTRLELNLAELSDAPAIFRER